MKIWLMQLAEFLPTDQGGERLLRMGILAQVLVNRGHEVLWWTSTFNHHHKEHRSNKDKYVDISRSYRIAMLRGSGYRRNISLSRMFDQFLVSRKFMKLSKKEEKPDIIIASFPSIDLSLAAAQYGTRNGVPVILDMRDMWPDIFTEFVPRPLKCIVNFFLTPMFNQAQKACAMATAICGITEPFVEWGLKIGRRKRTVLDKSFPMGCFVKHIATEQIREAEIFWDNNGVKVDKEKLTLCFIGSVNQQFDLDTVILAVRKSVANGQALRLVVCGKGEKLDYYKKLSSCDPNIIFTGWVNAAKLYVLMKRSSLGLDPLPDRFDYIVTINNKAIEYMSVGLPVISCPNKGLLQDVLKEYECGLSYEYRDIDGLVGILDRLSRDNGEVAKMSRNALELFKGKFDANKVYGAMGQYIEELAKQSKIK